MLKYLDMLCLKILKNLGEAMKRLMFFSITLFWATSMLKANDLNNNSSIEGMTSNAVLGKTTSATSNKHYALKNDVQDFYSSGSISTRLAVAINRLKNKNPNLSSADAVDLLVTRIN